MYLFSTWIGMSSLDAILEAMWHTKQNISYTFILGKLQFYSSRAAKVVKLSWRNDGISKFILSLFVTGGEFEIWHDEKLAVFCVINYHKDLKAFLQIELSRVLANQRCW